MTYIPMQVRQLAIDHDSALKAWMIYLGVSQEELAQRLNLTQPAISQYCNRKKHQKGTLVKVSNALGIKVEQLNFDPTKISLMTFR